MVDQTLAGHWIRRFLMEYAASERNLSANTCASYRDMLVLLLPYVAKRKGVSGWVSQSQPQSCKVGTSSGEQVRAGLGELHVDPGFMPP